MSQQEHVTRDCIPGADESPALPGSQPGSPSSPSSPASQTLFLEIVAAHVESDRIVSYMMLTDAKKRPYRCTMMCGHALAPAMWPNEQIRMPIPDSSLEGASYELQFWDKATLPDDPDYLIATASLSMSTLQGHVHDKWLEMHKYGTPVGVVRIKAIVTETGSEIPSSLSLCSPETEHFDNLGFSILGKAYATWKDKLEGGENSAYQTWAKLGFVAGLREVDAREAEREKLKKPAQLGRTNSTIKSPKSPVVVYNKETLKEAAYVYEPGDSTSHLLCTLFPCP